MADGRNPTDERNRTEEPTVTEQRNWTDEPYRTEGAQPDGGAT